MSKTKIKEIIIKYTDDTEEIIDKGMLVQVVPEEFVAEFRVRTFNFEKDDLQLYLRGFLHFAAKKIDNETMDILEAEADYLEFEKNNHKKKGNPNVN